MARNEGPPDWMNQDSAPRPAREGSRQTHSYVKADLSSLHQDEAVRAAFPESVVKGVKIIAWLMLINTAIGISFAVVSIFPPRGTETGFSRVVTIDDYFSPIRLIIALALGIALAVGAWNAVGGTD